MKGRMYVIHPESGRVPTVTGYREPPGLKELQEAVGGYIETVPHLTTIRTLEDKKYVSCIAYCNEEGKLEQLPYNARATLAWDIALRRIEDSEGTPVYPNGLRGKDNRPTDILVGPIAVLVGDAEFMRRHIMQGDEKDEDGNYVEDWWEMYGEFFPACEKVQS
jgi:hypothetical protein